MRRIWRKVGSKDRAALSGDVHKGELGIDIELGVDEVAKVRSGIVMIMSKDVMERYSPGFAIVEDPERVVSDEVQLLSPLIELFPHDIPFHPPVRMVFPVCVGANTAWRFSRNGEQEELHARFLAGHVILDLDHFCHIGVGTSGEKKAVEVYVQPYVKCQKSTFEARCLLLHLNCRGCDNRLHDRLEDKRFLRGFSACFPHCCNLCEMFDRDELAYTWEFGDENGSLSPEQKKTLKFSQFPLELYKLRQLPPPECFSIHWACKSQDEDGTADFYVAQEPNDIVSQEASTRIECAEAVRVSVSWTDTEEAIADILRHAPTACPCYQVQNDPPGSNRVQVQVDVDADALYTVEGDQLASKVHSDVSQLKHLSRSPAAIFETSTPAIELGTAKRDVQYEPAMRIWELEWFKYHANGVGKEIQECKRLKKRFTLVAITSQIDNRYTREEMLGLFEYIWTAYGNANTPFDKDVVFNYQNMNMKMVSLDRLSQELESIVSLGDAPIIVSCATNMSDEAKEKCAPFGDAVKWKVSERGELYKLPNRGWSILSRPS